MAMSVVFFRPPIPHSSGVYLRCLQWNIPAPFPHFDQTLTFASIKACRDAVVAAGFNRQIAEQEVFGPMATTMDDLLRLGYRPQPTSELSTETSDSESDASTEKAQS